MLTNRLFSDTGLKYFFEFSNSPLHIWLNNPNSIQTFWYSWLFYILTKILLSSLPPFVLVCPIDYASKSLENEMKIKKKNFNIEN